MKGFFMRTLLTFFMLLMTFSLAVAMEEEDELQFAFVELRAQAGVFYACRDDDGVSAAYAKKLNMLAEQDPTFTSTIRSFATNISKNPADDRVQDLYDYIKSQYGPTREATFSLILSFDQGRFLTLMDQDVLHNQWATSVYLDSFDILAKKDGLTGRLKDTVFNVSTRPSEVYLPYIRDEIEVPSDVRDSYIYGLYEEIKRLIVPYEARRYSF